MGHSFGCIVVSATVAGARFASIAAAGRLAVSGAGRAVAVGVRQGHTVCARNPGLLPRHPEQAPRARADRHDAVEVRHGGRTLLSDGRAGQAAARARQRRVSRVRRHRDIRHSGRVRGRGSRDGQGHVRVCVSPAARIQPRGERVIKDGDGASGAHSDIAHPEVAHAFWAAVLASIDGPPSSWAANRNPRPLPPRQATLCGGVGRDEECASPIATSPPTRSGLLGPRPRRRAGGSVACSAAPLSRQSRVQIRLRTRP